MNPLLVAPLAVVGLAAGPGLRAVIVRYDVPAAEPPRCQLRSACAAPLTVEVTALLLGTLAARVHPGRQVY